MQFSGWTMRQWAIACAAYPQPIKTLDDAMEVQVNWKIGRLYEPGEELIRTPDRDWEKAKQVLLLAYDAMQNSFRPRT